MLDWRGACGEIGPCLAGARLDIERGWKLDGVFGLGNADWRPCSFAFAQHAEQDGCDANPEYFVLLRVLCIVRLVTLVLLASGHFVVYLFYGVA